jgi:hypothetical protein
MKPTIYWLDAIPSTVKTPSTPRIPRRSVISTWRFLIVMSVCVGVGLALEVWGVVALVKWIRS